MTSICYGMVPMRDFSTRVIQVRFTSDPESDCLRKVGPTRFTVVVLYPLEVKRRLVTVDTAKGRAVELARHIIERDCFCPPILEALRQSVEVAEYDLRPFQRAHWMLEDGTKVWLSEVRASTRLSVLARALRAITAAWNGGKASGVVDSALRRAETGLPILARCLR